MTQRPRWKPPAWVKSDADLWLIGVERDERERPAEKIRAAEAATIRRLERPERDTFAQSIMRAEIDL